MYAGCNKCVEKDVDTMSETSTNVRAKIERFQWR